MKSAPEIRTLALHLKANLETNIESQILNFPATWSTLMRETLARMWQRPLEETSVPVNSLNRALLTLIPDLISVNKYAGAAWMAGKPWLYTAHPPDVDSFKLIVQAWVNVAFKKALQADQNAIHELIAQAPVVWKTHRVPLNASTTHPNGTAKPDPELFTLLPDFLASQLEHCRIPLENGPLTFVRNPIQPGGRGAELISWPPREHQGSYFSLGIKLTVQTQPFHPKVFVHVDLGMRRWLGRKDKPAKLEFGRKATQVLLRSSLPWLPGMQHSNSFQTARMKYDRASKRDEWADGLPEIISALNLQHPFPETHMLLQDPIKHLAVNGTANAAIVFRYGHTPVHPSKSGLSATDRQMLAISIANHLEPWLEWAEMPQRIDGKLPKPRPLEPHQRRLELRDALKHPDLEVELWHQTPQVRDALHPEVKAVFNPTQEEGIRVHINAQHLGPMGATLELGQGKGALETAVNARATDIAQAVSQAKKPTLALVELDHLSAANDPKYAIRLGLAKTGRISQFITPGEHSLEHRANRAVLDGLRQLGDTNVSTWRQDFPWLPHNLEIVGVWLLDHIADKRHRRKVKLPVLVHLNADQPGVRVQVPGLTTALPYHEALYRIARGEARPVKEDKDALTWFQERFKNDLSGHENLFLIARAQNWRRVWKWLQDQNITRDRVQIHSTNEPVQSGLRIARVRDNESAETPEWYVSNTGRASLTAGVFAAQDRVFYSIHNPPVSFKTYRTGSKLESWASTRDDPDDDLRAPSPDLLAWNPNLLEIVLPCLQPTDDPESWATLVHHMRVNAVQYKDATKLPLPLHLASLIKEYLPPANGQADESEDLE
jgi:pPIWI_RE module N-terminal domain/RNaseH domain of pPIWI_RE/MID domain of pPIWI_RE